MTLLLALLFLLFDVSIPPLSHESISIAILRSTIPYTNETNETLMTDEPTNQQTCPLYILLFHLSISLDIPNQYISNDMNDSRR